MNVAVYQMKLDPEYRDYRFESIDAFPRVLGEPDIDSSMYDKVFDGNVECSNLNSVYDFFNSFDRPNRKTMRSMSVSDVIEIKDDEGSVFWYCDTDGGFVKIPFDSSRCTDLSHLAVNIPNSSVRISCSKDGLNVLTKCFKSQNSDLLKKLSIDKESKDLCYLGWDNIKWDNLHKALQVKTIIDALSDLKRQNYSFSFVRQGKDKISNFENMDYFGDKEGMMPFPSVSRKNLSFDDDVIINEINKNLDKEAEEKSNQGRFFFDMDGTLTKFDYVPNEKLYKEGYFKNLKPNMSVVNYANALIKSHMDVYILSCYLPNSQYALQEKKDWLKKYLPNLDADKQIFVPYDTNKADYIASLGLSPVCANDVLYDDYTKNLQEWKNSGGHGVKYLNGINNTHGTWDGAVIQNVDLNIMVLGIEHNHSMQIKKDDKNKTDE